MANPNENVNQERTESKKRDFPITAFTVPGFDASSTTFIIPMNTIEDEILKIAKDFIKDFSYCTISPDSRNRNEIHYMLWIPANSGHLVDKNVGNNSILRKGIQEQSRDMKNFLKRFANPDNSNTRNPEFRFGRVLRLKPDSNFEQNLVAVVIDPVPFIDLMFDASGTAYKQEFNRERAGVCHLNLNYRYKNQDSKFPETLVVTKSTRTASSGLPMTRFCMDVRGVHR